MPGNSEEKEKCLEKLNQMQKFIPFLDFMIDKIKKKNNEISLECQLSKFQLLRSMIAEKSGKYTWDAIVKVEDVIEKLITKLDFKEQYEKSKENLAKSDNQCTKNNMATSLSIVPSSTTGVSVTTTSNSQVTAGDIKPQDFSNTTVDLIMKTFKISVDEGANKPTDRGTEVLTNSLRPNQPVDVSGIPMETDLDKDLDGFDLTDCPGLSETEPNNSAVESAREVAEKASSHDDLLTSSREKLLKSLQSRLYSCRTNIQSSQPPAGEKSNDSEVTSAFSRSQVNSGEPKTKSDVSENSEQVDRNKKVNDTQAKIPAKQVPVISKPIPSLSYSEKARTDSANGAGDGNHKQKLKEKLSTDICEVYKVPGKSVGGSLRSLKESKDPKKNFVAEEVELLKPDRSTEKRPSKHSSTSHGKSSSERKESQGDKSRRDSSSEKKVEKQNEKTSQKHSSRNDGKNEKCKSNVRKELKNKNQKTESSEGSESRESGKDGKKEIKKSGEKSSELGKLNDDELLDFVKENMQSLPHLAKLKPSELRKAIQTSLLNNLNGLDAVSEISDDSFQDPEELEGCQPKVKTNPKGNSKTQLQPSVKKSPAGADKNNKQNVESRKSGKSPEISRDESLKKVQDGEEDDYALKLIEETTTKIYPLKKKKKGLLELPMPITDDLFEDISSVESFEPPISPSETRDPRLRKDSENKNKSNNTSKPEPNPDASKVGLGSNCATTDLSQRPHTIGPAIATGGKTQRVSLDPRLNKQSQCSQGENQFSSRLQNETTSSSYAKPHVSVPCVNHPKLPSYKSSEPKSYAEYKRLKLKEKEKLGGQSKDSPKTTSVDVSHAGRLTAEKEGERTKKNPNLRFSGQRQTATKQNSTKPFTCRPRKKGLNSEQQEKQLRRKKKRRHLEEMRKEDAKRVSVDSEELVSPLEELYRNEDKPKTGRGYGIQNFKIPKKVQKPACQVSEKSNTTQTNNPKVESEADATKKSKESEMGQTNISENWEDENWDIPTVSSTVTEDISSKTIEKSSTDDSKTNSSIRENESASCDTADSVGSAQEPENPATLVEQKTEETPAAKGDTTTVSTNEPETSTEEGKKCEALMVECDSSVEASETGRESGGDKSGAVAKEEITQEFVEALIRKSFQSGEGKLLLAQMKLFEELARKLNSKKLKTIQRIINSESGSSSSSNESYSDDERRKKKTKRSEQKTKKRKKKGKKSRKHKSSSSSSSSESEGSEEEDATDKKEEKTSRKNETENPETASTSEESKSAGKEESSPSPKTVNKNRRGRIVDLGKHFSGRRAKRKQTQKKLLERILNESPQPEATGDQPAKTKPKPKAKAKTELDRLHDDIRNMFISEGVVTATGKRMCRILKQSGGNMNNLDIVKESAKMVEEERLKRGQTRSSPRNPRSSENRSRSQSLDKLTKQQQDDHEQDSKLRLAPRVVLRRVDLDNFGYGEKVSEDCISFRRMRGRNTAIRTNSRFGPVTGVASSRSREGNNVFLPRNKRKFERLKESKRKKSYIGKKLMDVVKNLPLKMAKMKHLKISEIRREGETNKKKKNLPEKLSNKAGGQKNGLAKVGLSNEELLNYAFEKKRRMYLCKLCSHGTKNITEHYQNVHPEHEVLISRLCFEEAKSAKLESRRAGITEESPDGGDEGKRKSKAVHRRNNTYNCRMCQLSKIVDVNAFAAHVSSHTGEARFRCPEEECNARVYSREGLKFHVLTKHSKSRPEFANKVVELYQLTIEDGEIYGYLCSACHFVQLCRGNVENHVARQHGSLENTTIIKINMCSSKAKCAGKRNSKKGSKEESNDPESDDEEDRSDDGDAENPGRIREGQKVGESVGTRRRRKRKQRSEDESPETESGGPEMELVENKRIFLDENADFVEITRKASKGDSGDPLKDEDDADEGEDNLGSDMDMEDCVDLKSISALKGSDIISSMENSDGSEFAGANSPKTVGTRVKLKVGPLEALLSENSEEVLYECYVKGCLFSTRVSDLFEKHIKISHWKTKWNGVCDICSAKTDSPLRDGENSFKLLTALKHLKLHEREKNGGGKLSAEDLIMELKLLKPSEDEKDPNSVEEEEKEETEGKEGQTQAKMDTSDTPYPVKPLLRVRNLLGDRLSTPKADETDVVALNEEGSNSTESSTDSSKMFTIENVRSLTESQEADNELKIEQVCSLKDLISKPGTQLGSGKTIIVRSCPTRKIAIRPEPSTLSVDVGHINVVQPPVVGHPVVLSPVPGSSPIRIISAAGLSPKPKFTVKPIVVSADAVRLNAPNLVPVIRPSLSPSVTATTIIPVTSPSEPKTSSKKSGSQESDPGGGENESSAKPSLEVEVISLSKKSKSPPAPSVTIHHHPGKNSSSDVEEVDEKEPVTTQRLATSPSTGKKSVKDAKIYQEMLTKTKLCHLFKCMGIECSFTCNNENVFTQHIGLHEAQRRLRRDKGIKTIYLRSANKTTRAFYWQQCAYCCEVVSNTNKALSQHILEEHGHCMYQCAFCFYRAVSHCYVEIHQNLAHSQILKTTPRLIYKCKPLKVPPSQFVALEKHGRKQSVRPYHCDQCGRKFYITHEFTNHLAKEHQSVTAYTCHICKNLCFKINRLINHYKLHSYSTYQCAYCLHGTETEKEMIFHLCNFHFSQPAVMYVRALAEGQSEDEKLKPNKKKKHLSNQLDSLKVIVYESDTPNLDCIVDAEGEEDIPDNVSESSLDLSSIVAELGIYTDPQSSTGVTPLMKELASIGDKGGKNLTVKTLLPNAQFSSENESGAENCSVLISSGLSVPSDSNSEREMNIPLGQLPLEAVNVQHKETAPSSPSPGNSVATPDRNLKLNEIIVNLQHKEKGLVLQGGSEEEKTSQPSTAKLSSAVHKLPPVVLGRGSTIKNAYPSKVKKKSEESGRSSENTEEENTSSNDSNGKTANSEGKPEDSSQPEGNGGALEKVKKASGNGEGAPGSIDQPLITNVVSLSKGEFDKEDSGTGGDDSIIVSDVCLVSDAPAEAKNNSGILINIKTNVNVPSVLKPPIIRVEDFPIDGDNSSGSGNSNESAPEPKENAKPEDDEKTGKPEEKDRPSSPDIIILENSKPKDIVMVTIDSDEEKDEKDKKKKKSKDSKPEPPTGNETIRQEMEKLRKQMANETDSLLLEEEVEKPARGLSLDIQPSGEEDPKSKTLLSPIEEAICSLNKKLQSETEEAQKKEEDEKKDKGESPSKSEGCENRPRTRFGARERRSEATEKSEGDECNGKKEEPVKGKKFKEELTGKDLFICGNEKCNFAADDDATLKDHLYVCDLSRESSMFVCPHCSRQIKQFHPYLEHLKYHGEKKFHCGLCSFSSAVDTSVSRHVKQKHKCSVIKILPKESKEGHLAYYPKNYKVEKIDFEVNGYSPGDEDKLPLQSVYQVNVKCAKCPYFTKVRSNMVRHLKIHVKSVETEGVVVVPSTAPTNPVPCLETKERMFDKMTNLAASSQLAQAKDKVAVESLSPEEEAKLPQFVTEQMRYKCCLPDCNYITVDEGMLKHHIKALHDEINYYSCPHCRSTVHADVRHVTLDKIGFHLKHHDAKLYKCAHCIFFHYQKNVVEKHTAEKHPDRRFFVHTVREPKSEATSEEEPSSSETGARVWKCGLCDDFQSISKSTLMDHLLKSHNTKSKYKCQLCSMKGNSNQAFTNHFASKHPGEKVSYVKLYYSDKAPSSYVESGNSSGADSSNEHFDTTPLWQRGAPRIRHIRGILIEEEEIKTKKSKKASVNESETETTETANVNENMFYCPLCTNKKKTFYTRSEDYFRSHLYQELNYHQFACILCGKMFVDRKDFEKHHVRVHGDKPRAWKQTNEDHEIKFWVDQVIAKRRKQMEERKRKMSEAEASGSQGGPAPKKKKEV